MHWIIAVAVMLQDETKQELDQLRKRVEELERKAGQTQPEAPPDRDRGEVYSKPFLARIGDVVRLGGYIDLEYISVQDSNNDTFDQHRLVPFIYADISKHIKVATEIEIEHGNGTELGVEFAHIDYFFTDAIGLRAGIVLDPLGKFNLVHDAPFQDLTLRPLVCESILGTVLREPGAGFFGELEAGTWEIDYEIYVVNGFKGLSKAGVTVIDRTNGLRSARPHGNQLGTSRSRDFNDNKAVVARISASPFLGLEWGLSAHTGKYDERGNNTLTVYAVDLTLNVGSIIPGELASAFEIVGEWARADIGRDSLAMAAGVPDDFDGWYVELRFHFMPESWRKAIPGAGEDATFTLVYRYDALDLDGAERSAHTFGVNFRPREDTVFKFEYQLRGENGTLSEIDNDAFVASVATYF